MSAAAYAQLREVRCNGPSFVVLTVGLDERSRYAVQRCCARRGWICRATDDGGEAAGYLRTAGERPGAILCADTLADGSWRRLLGLPARLILVSRLADERLWAEALNLGVFDLLSNPFTRMELEWSMDSARLEWEQSVTVQARSQLTRAAAG
jgi:hypothetical protein